MGEPPAGRLEARAYGRAMILGDWYERVPRRNMNRRAAPEQGPTSPKALVTPRYSIVMLIGLGSIGSASVRIFAAIWYVPASFGRQ